MGLIDVLRRVPLDIERRAWANSTEGKQIAASLAPDGVGKNALDLGAGEGHQTRWLRERGYRVIPVDLVPSFEGCLRMDANLDLPFASGVFDLVWSSEVIEHLEDPAHLIKELRRVTAPGGDVLLTTRNSRAWWIRTLALFGLPPERVQPPGHLHFFDLNAIRSLASDADLYGHVPYDLAKGAIRRGIGALSPTFVVHIRR